MPPAELATWPAPPAADALDAAYRRLFPVIREKCARMLGDRGEGQDVAQETFVRLWRAGLAAADPRTVTAWIYRTSTRLAIDHLRRRKLRAAEDLSTAATAAVAVGGDPEEVLGSRQAWALLARAVPSRELEVAMLARCDRLTQEEIAEVARVSDRTVRRLLVRFEERLEALRREEAGHDRA